ncbi:MAG: DUF2130 domain-containing protein [Chitinophagaceae bacterium]
MPANIKCPKCSQEFNVDEVLSANVEQKFQKQFEQKLQEAGAQVEAERKILAEAKQKFEENKTNENAKFLQRLKEEKTKLEAELQKELRQSISDDFENRLRHLQNLDREKDEKLKVAQQKEIEFMRKEQALKTKENELELELQKKLVLERNNLSEQIRKEEEKRFAIKEEDQKFKVKELEKQLDDQRRLTEEMKRKQEQGSMQLQGEVQELMLEEVLQEHFPYDTIGEVGKGVEGADCIQIVRNSNGAECGKIIFESKRTKSWNNVWIDKLKTDMRSKGADIAVLVTQVYPKDVKCFGIRDGVWICSFSEVASVTTALRHTIIRIAETAKAEENKGEKMQMLYGYLTGIEFRQHMETIVEGFLTMKNAISRERLQMEKLWKEREKQLERVLLSTSGLYGSIKGIAGASVGTIALLEDGLDDEEGPVKLLIK